MGHKGNHHLRVDLMPLLNQLARRLKNRLNLHLIDLRIGHTEPAASMTQHGIELMKAMILSDEIIDRDGHLPREILKLGVCSRKKLMKGRVQEPNGYRQPLHRLEDLLEITLHI